MAWGPPIRLRTDTSEMTPPPRGWTGRFFDDLLVGMASTHPNDAAGLITDSAAAATAMATGIKTYNGAIAVDSQQRPLETVLERARKRGYQTAMVVTSSVTHATPASFAAHVNDREQHEEIARQFVEASIDDKPVLDLLIGGGRQYFLQGEVDLLAVAAGRGFNIVEDLESLAKLQSLPALALLDHGPLPSALGGGEPVGLGLLTRKSFELLGAGDKPFFLLIEASQIDWCGHARDIACVMTELRGFAEAIGIAKGFVEDHPDSTLVITADHETGGLTLGAATRERWRPETIRGVQQSSIQIVGAFHANPESWQDQWDTLTAIALTTEEQGQLGDAVEQLVRASALSEDGHDEALPEKIDFDYLVHCAELAAVPPGLSPDSLCASLLGLQVQVVGVINKRTHTGWTGAGHTAVDVPVFAVGRFADKFRGAIDNTDIGKGLFEILQ